MMLQFLIAALASLAFSILLHAPRRMYPVCAVVGGATWIAYLLALEGSGLAAVACFAASLLLTVFSRFASVLYRTPVIVFITAGIFPLVPGTGIYRTAYSLFAGSPLAAAQAGTETLIIAGTIALGILFGSAVPQALFTRLCRPFVRKAKVPHGS